MNTAMERLSTGKRINSAQDDAAGLAIASKMTSQINSLDQAVRNAGDAISLVQSADGAMIEITNMVQRMRELAIQAISDTNTLSDREALNLEFQALAAEVSRIGGNTQWNGGNILDGLSGVNGTSTFHIGANANQVITATMPTIGSVEGDFTAATTRAATANSSDYVAPIKADFTINIAASALTGASSGQTITIVSTPSSGSAKTATIALHGDHDGDNNTAVAPMFSGLNAAFIAAVNTALDAASIAYTAELNGTSGIKLVQDTAAPETATITSTLAGSANTVTAGTTGVAAAGTAGNIQQSTLTLSSTFNTLRNGDTITYTIDGRAAAATVTSSQNPDGSWTMSGITNLSSATGITSGAVTLAFVSATSLTLTGTNPNESFKVDNVQVTRGIAADVGQTDIATFATATAALSVLDTAVASVNMKRAELGAVANRLEYAADNMSQVAMNARQSRSRVEDADYASETTELARTQIIQQAGTAMLAQANQSTQSVLKLLQ
jgi:flagellin